MQYHSLPPVEPQPKAPFLPRDQMSIDSKRRPLRLLNYKRLKTRTFRFRLEIMMPLFRFMWNVLHIRRQAVIIPNRKLNDIDQLFRDVVNDRREWQRIII
jgi:hypothetical protein